MLCCYTHAELEPGPLLLFSLFTVTLLALFGCCETLCHHHLLLFLPWLKALCVCLWCTSDIRCHDLVLLLEVWPFTPWWEGRTDNGLFSGLIYRAKKIWCSFHTHVDKWTCLPIVYMRVTDAPCRVQEFWFSFILLVLRFCVYFQFYFNLAPLVSVCLTSSCFSLITCD